VCHCPPKDTALDEAGPEKHFGSPAVLRFIERVKPEWFFCGHIHEAWGNRQKIEGVEAVNLGKKGFVLEV